MPNAPVILSSVLYTTRLYYCHFATWHQLSIYLPGDHLIILKDRDSIWYGQMSIRSFPYYHWHALCYINVRLLLIYSNMLSITKK
jgi:hypothetical protein